MRHLAPCALAAAALLGAGCAGDTVETGPQPGQSSKKALPEELPADVVARVGDEDITKAEARHWIDAARRQGEGCGGTAQCREQAMQFLVSAEWLIQHAERSRVVVTEKEIDRTFAKQKREAFPREADYRKFLRQSGRSEADLRFQVKLSLLTNKMQKSIGGSGRGATEQERLNVFVEQFRRRYKRQTVCRRAYSPKKQCGKIVD